MRPLSVSQRWIRLGPFNGCASLKAAWSLLKNPSTLMSSSITTTRPTAQFTSSSPPASSSSARPPPDLAEQRPWIDHDDGRRFFSPAHFAEIFHDNDVQLIVRCSRAPAVFESSPFIANGILIKDLSAPPPGASPAAMMAAVDRFLTLVAAAPG